MAYLKKCDKSNLYPEMCGIVSRRGLAEEININQYLVGNKFAEVLSKGLKLSKATNINVAANRLSPVGGLKILQGLNYNVKQINIANNNIGKSTKCIEYLTTLLKDKRYEIEELNLDCNKISDIQVAILSECLMTNGNRVLRTLSLGENSITDSGATSLAEMLECNSTGLKELKLCWNKIQAKGSILIAEALKCNSQLKVLDLSWNSSGSASSAIN